ncbi:MULTISPECIES: Hsp20/alpha crystallin family protein [unclassified Saccharothrix]|uniref:Hsp20/alpha crystallin family protein n=1 Tax=unclassified Saccharothrix TaxID=2593673 RepID=UPI00307E9A62
MEWLTVHRGRPDPGPLRDMDRWWNLIGRTLGRDWDVTTDDADPHSVDVVVTRDAYLIATVVPSRDVRVEVHDHDVRPDGVPVLRSRVGITARPSSGRYYFCATIPAEVDVDRIEAWLLDGVLVVRAPLTWAGRATA